MDKYVCVLILLFLIVGCTTPNRTNNNSRIIIDKEKIAELNKSLQDLQNKIDELNNSLSMCQDNCPSMIKLEDINCDNAPNWIMNEIKNLSWFKPEELPCIMCAACGVCSCTLENYLISSEYRISKTFVSCEGSFYQLHFRGNSYDCQINLTDDGNKLN